MRNKNRIFSEIQEGWLGTHTVVVQHDEGHFGADGGEVVVVLVVGVVGDHQMRDVGVALEVYNVVVNLNTKHANGITIRCRTS